MDDLISRQQAIDLLNDSAELLRRVLDNTDIVGAERKTYEWELRLTEAYISDMKELPSAQQWIPCSERLPKEDSLTGRGNQFSDIVLVTCVHHANDNEHFIDMAQIVNGEWRFIRDTNECYSLSDCCEIIAWMERPEPYEGEKR